jgi:hypothetical protein
MNQAKALFRDVFDDMVERKLWPVALILLVALIAIPVLLAKPASKPTPLQGAAQTAPAVSGAPSPLTAFEPVVSSSTSSNESKGLRGAAKDPFHAKGIDFAAAKAAGSVEPVVGGGNATVSTGDTAQGAGDTTLTDGNTQGGSTTTPDSSQGKTTFYTYTAKVKFGEEGDTKARTLSQFRALPSADNPVAIFMGVKRDGETAVFLLSSSTTTTGDGNCEPTDSECTFLYLKAGDSQVVETVTTDGEIVTYDLELVSVDAKATTGPAKAGASNKAGASKKANASAERKASRHAARVETRRALRAFSRLGF